MKILEITAHLGMARVLLMQALVDDDVLIAPTIQALAEAEMILNSIAIKEKAEEQDGDNK